MTDLLNEPSGAVFLDKPYGWTSRRAVNEIIRLYTQPGQKRIKAGHAGTLDPLATGMLPILVGEATRFAELGLDAEKRYNVTIDLSYQTSTLDCEGEVTARFETSVAKEAFQEVVANFIGPQQQSPPAYSAIRINGQRAHILARKGEHVEMAARPITIFDIRILDFRFPVISIEVHCSKGTYIRSLARDIGIRLGMGGCVTSLRRLSTGGWPETMMVSMEQIKAQRGTCLMPVAQWLQDFEHQKLGAEQASRFLQGQRLQVMDSSPDDSEKKVVVFEEKTILGTAVLKSGLKHMVLHPDKILPSAQQRYL